MSDLMARAINKLTPNQSYEIIDKTIHWKGKNQNLTQKQINSMITIIENNDKLSFAIEELEKTQTLRTLREATLGNQVAIDKLNALENEIKLLRSKML